MSYGWRQMDGTIAEICDECGFDSRRVRNVIADLRSTLLAMQALLSDPDADRRPAAETWSAAEYVDHTILVIVECISEVAEVAGLAVGAAPTNCQNSLQFLATFGEDIAGHDLDGVFLEVSFATLTGTHNLLHALHDAEHHLLDIRRGYARFGLARGEDLYTTVR